MQNKKITDFAKEIVNDRIFSDRNEIVKAEMLEEIVDMTSKRIQKKVLEQLSDEDFDRYYLEYEKDEPDYEVLDSIVRGGKLSFKKILDEAFGEIRYELLGGK